MDGIDHINRRAKVLIRQIEELKVQGTWRKGRSALTSREVARKTMSKSGIAKNLSLNKAK